MYRLASRKRCQRGRLGQPFPVDCRNLAQLVIRRCEGCSGPFHRETARRFLEQQQYPEETRQQVLALLDKYLRRRDRDGAWPSPPPARQRWRLANGSTLCRCGARFYEHPRLPDRPWLTQLCNGSLVKLD